MAIDAPDLGCDARSAAPAEPFADAEARARPRRSWPRATRSSNCQPPDPRQSGAGVRGAPGGRVGRRRRPPPRLRGGTSRRPARDGGSRDAVAGGQAGGDGGRGSGSSPSTTRCPDSGTAAVTTRWPRPGSRRRSGSRRSPTDLPGEIVFLGTPAEERGSGKQCMIDDGLFDGRRRRAPVPSLVDDARRVPAARLRGRRRHVQRAGRPTRPRIRGRDSTPSTRW